MRSCNRIQRVDSAGYPHKPFRKDYGDGWEGKKGLASDKEAAAPQPAVSAVPAMPSAGEDEELIAVITAAVSAVYEGSGKSYVVKSVRPARRAGERPVWAAAGLRDNTRTF